MDVALYEPRYLDGQTTTEGCLPWRVSGSDHAAWREFRTLVEIYRSGAHREHELTGVVSPKFVLKTGVSPAQFRAFAAASGSQICLANPGPQYAYCSLNVWTMGETSHAGLVECASRLLTAADIDLVIDTSERHGPNVLCYSNFWVGPEVFWESYVGGVLDKLAKFIEANPLHPAVSAALVDTVHTTPTPYLPFIVERLFTCFLSQRHIKVEPMQLDTLALCLYDFERDIVTAMQASVDEADAQPQFPSSTAALLNMTTKLLWRYGSLYFEHNRHPHAV